MLAVAATARAQGQPPPAEQATTLADVPLGPSVTVTVERRGDIVLVGLNRPFIQNRIDPPTRLRLAATVLSVRARRVAPCARALRPRRELLARH
jgi:hypothetical protein